MNEDFSLKKEELQCLQRCIGKDVLMLCTGQEPENGEFWWPIYLRFDDRDVLKVENRMTAANYFDGKEDCGRLSVAKVKENIPDVYTKTIRQTIQNVKVVTNMVHYPATETAKEFRFVYPKALIFEMSDGVLVVERGWFFQEALNVHLQSDKTVSIDDEMADWYDPSEDEVKPLIEQRTTSLH